MALLAIKGFGISGPMSLPRGSISLLPGPFQGVGIWGWVCPGGGYSPPGLGMAVGMGMPSGWVGTHPSGVDMSRSGSLTPKIQVQKRVVRILLLNLIDI